MEEVERKKSVRVFSRFIIIVIYYRLQSEYITYQIKPPIKGEIPMLTYIL